MQNTLSLVKDVRGCMTRFDPLTPKIVADQTEDDLTYDELKEVLEECGMDINKVVFDGTRAFQNAFYADFEQGHYCWIPFQKKSLKDVIRTMDQQFHSESFGLSRKNHEWTTFYMMDVPLPMQIYAAECYLVPDRHDHRGGHRRDRLRVYFQKPKEEVQYDTGVFHAVPLVAAYYPDLLLHSALFQLRHGLVCRQYQPLF